MEPISPVSTTSAPAAGGPYSQGIVIGDLVFVSGQLAIDPATGHLEAGGFGEQTTRVMRNLAAVLEAAGSGLERVVKTTIYLTDMGAFAEVNEAYAAALGEHRPARATIGVAALPRGAQVEIEAVATLRARG